MILNIQKKNKLVIAGDITAQNLNKVEQMFYENKTLEEVKNYLLSVGHITVEERTTTDAVGIITPEAEERDFVNFIKAINELTELFNNVSDVECSKSPPNQ